MRAGAIILISVFIINLTLVSCQSDFGDLQFDKLNFDLNNGSQKNSDDIMDKGPVKGGTLNLFSTFPDTLNPLLTKNAYVSDFLSFVYEGLVTLDKKQQPMPLLSDKWAVSPDGLIWNFHIRDGVTWSDGEALTAKDAEFTFDFILNTNVDSVYKKQLKNISTFAAVDSSNFKIVLLRPNSFTAEMMTFPILPAHLRNDLYETADFKPVGTGPFKLDKYLKEKSVTLKRNDTWWYINAREDKSSEIMFMDEIRIKLYKSDDDAINAFQVYEIDAAGISMDDIKKYTSRTDMIIKKYPSREFEFLAFNLHNPVFADISVRKAVAAAIDRQKIVNDILDGYATISDIPIHPDSWLSEGLKRIPADFKEYKIPKDILLEGGWKEKESGFYKIFDGINKKLEIELLVNNNNNRRILVAERISRQLQEAGLAAKVTRLPWSDLYRLIDTGKFDMVYTGCRITQAPDVSFLYSSSYLPASLPVQNNIGRNIAGYDSMEANTLIELLYSQIDSDKEINTLSNFKNVIDSDLPYIGLFFLDNALIYRKNVRGKIEPYVWEKYHDITGWYLPDLQ
ncbi:MAG: peptide ABC transporter substrate-binding protein [Ruminiclostridium sp.]|nr:peptide ABC transporter substrate-binding protein [Ruminiclostridium sp.]